MRIQTTLFAVVLILGAGAARAGDAVHRYQGVPRVVAVGDIHGRYHELTGLLSRAGLVDAELRWDGGPAVLQSRAWDEAGNMQPTRAELVARRGEARRVPNVRGFPSQHYNGPTSWRVGDDGEVSHVYA